MYFDPPIKTSVIPLSNDVLPVSIQLIQMREQQSACAGTVTSVLFYFASTWWKFPQKQSSQRAPAYFSGCADIDRRVVAVWVAGVRLLPLGCSNSPLCTVQSQQRSSRGTPKTPRLPGFALADFRSGSTQIDIADVCWSVFTWRSGRQLSSEPLQAPDAGPLTLKPSQMTL